jgi:serine phosphatase RsbU (regulator of sigma subunit)/pSer/pThr/pTyr-binding forkhead associated (FHA) protein
MAFLHVDSGPTTGTQYTIEAAKTILGRHPECDVVLDVAAVSRQHAQIMRVNSDFLIEDLGSRNGTIVNGQLIENQYALKEGDHVKICDLDFTFFLTPPSAELAGPTVRGGDNSSIALLVDDPQGQSSSTVMSTFDVSSSRTGAFLTERPEVKLQAMMEIAQSLGKALSLEEVLPKLLDSLFKVFLQADRGFVVLRAGEDGPLAPKAVKHRHGENDATVRISRTIANQAMETREAILSADASTDDRFNMAQSIADFQIRSFMCAPLINGDGAALGVLQVDTLDQRRRFNEQDLQVLASVASQAAIAIDNAQLHERALRQNAIERDLELAHKVQKGLLPSEPPVVPGYHFFSYYDSANEVGGDYYDYVELPGGRMAVVLGDVSGKGVSAALLMAKLSAEVRFSLASETDPAVAVRRINATFARSGWSDRFVTFVAAVIDPAQSEVVIVNAGHMPPLLRHSNGKIEEIGEEEAGLPLGVADDYEYESYRHALLPGDFVTVYTDGISEAMNAAGDMYGIQRIHEAVSAEGLSGAALGERLLTDVQKFVDGHAQSDDMCVCCFGRDEA